MTKTDWRTTKTAKTLSELKEQIEKLESQEVSAVWDQEWALKTLQLTYTLQSHLLATGALGECRRATPYAPLKPVIDANGNFKWCCEHDPEHCV